MTEKTNFWPIGLCVLIGTFLLTVSNSWFHGDDFIHLDIFQIPVIDIFRNAFSGNVYGMHDPHYRPLNYLILGLGYKIGNPLLLRIFSVLIHILSGLTVYRIALAFNIKKATALFGLALFLVNPIIHSSLFWIPAFNDLLTTFFSLLVFLLFIGKSDQKTLAATFIFYTGALLSKEMAFALPLVILAYAAFQKKLREKTAELILLFSTATVFFLLRAHILGHFLMGERDSSFFSVSVNTLVNIFKYVFSFLFPTPAYLNFEYPVLFLSALPLLILFGLYSKSKGVRSALFDTFHWLTLFFLSLLPVLTSFGPWYMYFPSTLFVMSIVIMLDRTEFRYKNGLSMLYLGFMFLITAHWGNCYRKAGRYEMELLRKTAQIPESEIILVNVPACSYSYVPMFPNSSYIEAGLRHFHGIEKKIHLAGSRLAVRLPDSVSLSSLDSRSISLKLDPKQHSYYLPPETDSLYQTSYGKLNLIGKPCELHLTFKKDSRPYIINR